MEVLFGTCSMAVAIILSTYSANDDEKVFIILSAVGAVWAWLIVPETKGVPLEEMAAIFGDTDEIVVYLRDLHVDQKNDHLVMEKHDGLEGDHVEEVQEMFPHTGLEKGEMA